MSLLLWFFVAPGPAPGVAQDPVEGLAAGAVRSARLVADIAPGGTEAEVRVDYTVSRRGAPAGPLRLEVLGFGPASVASVRVDALAGGGVPGAAAGGGAIRLVPEAGGMRAAAVPAAAVPPGADDVVLSLAYRVAGAVQHAGPEVRVRLPVVVLDLPPEQGGGPVFHASVRVPEGWSVSGGFPTGLAPTQEGPWGVDLPVVPALVSLRGRSDGAWRPGLPETLDVLALTVLLGFGLVGWRHLRAVAGGPP